MSRREDLIKQHDEWINKYVEADNKFKAFFSNKAGLRKGEKMEFSYLTPDNFADFESVLNELDETRSKIRETLEEIWKLPPEES